MSISDYKTITVSGADAFDFLQAQLAADIANATDDAPMLAAWCNPKGRVICLFRVTRKSDDFALALPAELAESVLKRLTMFRFRSKVEFELAGANEVQLGMAGSVEDWRLDNLRAGIPEILQSQSEQWTPHMLNLDLLGAVSVDKGCYPGQEIVSRTHYRGKTRRRCLLFRCDGAASVGDKVSDGSRDVGEVINAAGNEVLAVVPLDKRDQQLTAAGSSLVHLPLAYLE